MKPGYGGLLATVITGAPVDQLRKMCSVTPVFPYLGKPGLTKTAL